MARSLVCRRRTERVVAVLDGAMLFIANSALLVILTVICWAVISRYFLRSPVSWAEDITSIAFAWFIFIAMVPIHNRRGHIGIDILTSRFPPGGRLLLQKGVDVFIAAFCFYTAYLCARQALVSHGTAHTTVLEIPLSVFFASLVLGFLLMGLRSLAYLFDVGPIPAHPVVPQE